MNDFQIYLFIEDYKQDDFGRFCVRIGDYYFPEQEWTDFGVRIVFDWADNIEKIFTNLQNEARLDFMDGNYRIDASVSDIEKNLHLRFIKENRGGDTIEYEQNVHFEHIANEILRIIYVIQGECRKSSNIEGVARIQTKIHEFLRAKEIYSTKIN